MLKPFGNILLLLGLCLFFLAGCLPNLNFAVGRQDNTLFSLGSDSANYSQISNQVVRTAATQIGQRYRLGGESPRTGFDCSGLIYWAYKQHGIKIPRVTTSQAKVGQKIGRNNLRAGDIVVFRTRNSPNGLHTGLYAGNNKFIHSPNARSRVKLEPLDGSWWGERFMYGRRVVVPRFAQES